MVNWGDNWQIYEPAEKIQLYNFGDGPIEKKDWAQWIEEWCQWLVNQPKGSNPALDKTGNDTINANQNRDVYFFAGSTGGKYERRCTIERNKAIFFPIVVDEESTAEFPSALENGNFTTASSTKLSDKCKEDQDNILSLEVRIDEGTSQEISLLTGSLVKYRQSTDVFDLNFPKGVDNLWDAIGGPSKAVADGYWLFIKPLQKPGKHTIYFHAIEDDFENEVMFYLTVNQ